RQKSGEDWYYVQPGLKGEKALEQSKLWRYAGVKDKAGAKGKMPPKDAPLLPTDKERADILQKWLEAGAPPFAPSSATPDAEAVEEMWLEVKDILDAKCLKWHRGTMHQFELKSY